MLKWIKIAVVFFVGFGLLTACPSFDQVGSLGGTELGNLSYLMDVTADPCENFWQYACGNFIRTYQPELSSYQPYISYPHLSLKIYEALIVKEAISDKRKTVVDFYDSCIDDRSTIVHAPVLEPSSSLISALLADTQLAVENVFFRPEVRLSIFSSSAQRVFAFLPREVERDVSWIDQVSITGDSFDYKTAIKNIERKLRSFEVSFWEQPLELTYEELIDFLSFQTWLDAESYFEHLLPDKEDFQRLKEGGKTINIYRPSYFKKLLTYLSELPKLEAWYYLMALNAYNMDILVHANQKEKAAYCTHKTIFYLWYELADYFRQAPSQLAKSYANQMAVALKDTLRKEITSLRWADNLTQELMRKKLEKMVFNIAPPLVSFSEGNLKMDPDDFRGNIKKARSILYGGIGLPVARNEALLDVPWYGVSAYYNIKQNNLVISPLLLLAPSMDVNYPHALNYGNLGSIISHEMIHGFDNLGLLLNEDGNMQSIVTEQSYDLYQRGAQCLVEDYNLMGVEGEKTVQENIADVGGLKMAFNAYKRQVGSFRTLVSSIGLTQDQLFFVAYAQSKCSVATRDYREALKQQDTHAEAQARVLGPLREMPEFGRAFSCPIGSRYFPIERCNLW